MQLLIVWHSRTRASQQAAFFAAQGARHTLIQMDSQQRITVCCMPALQVQAQDLLQAQAYLFCAPENLGSLSGEMKTFFDLNYYAVLEQLNGRPYSAIISAGSAGQGAAQQIERICTGWRLNLIHPITILNSRAQTPSAIAALKQLTPEQQQQSKQIGGLLAAHIALSLD